MTQLEVEATPYTPTEDKTRRRLLVAFGFILMLGFLYVHSKRSRLGVNSDHATSVLAAHDMASGNVSLDGWLFPPNTYWSTDLPVFAALARIVGVDPVLFHLAPAVIAAGVVLVGARLALLRRSRLAWLGAGAIVVLLALPHPLLSYAFLLGPQHVGTVLLCLLAFLFLGATAAWSWRWWLGAGFLALAVLGDPFAIGVGVAPVAVAGVTRGLRVRRLAAVVPSLAAAAAAAVVGFGLSRLIRAIGGYELARLLPLSPPEKRLSNVGALQKMLLSLLGAGHESRLSTADRVLHGIGAAVVVLALVVSVVMVVSAIIRSVLMRREVSDFSPGIGSPWLDDVLLAAFFGGAIAYVMLARPPADVTSTRYLSASLIYGVVLAGRRIAGLRIEKPAVVFVTRVGCAVIAGTYLFSSLLVLRGPQPGNHGQALGPWLASLGLREGFGSYWLSSITTVLSRDEVRVRSVVRESDTLLHVHRFNNSLKWYEPGDRAPNFVVFMPTGGTHGVDETSAIATFGSPDDVHDRGPYRVLVWSKNLLPDLRPPVQRQ